MAEKITSLTEEQKADMPVVREKWIRRAITDKWNPEKAEAAMKAMYTVAGIKEPTVICSPSPLASMREIARVEERPMAWVAPMDGAGWCSRRALYFFFDKHFGLAEKLRPTFALDEAGAFWWWVYEGYAFVCGPPRWAFDRGKVDGSEPYRLHSHTGPACEWPDGFKLWFWHGTSIDGSWLESPTWTPEKLQEVYKSQENMERKRILCEIAGWEAIAKALGATEIGHDDYGSLWSASLGDDGDKPAKFCRVTCPSTGRVYMLRVGPEITSCLGGLAQAAGVTEDEYRLIKES
jgi:hypothetical protein